MYVTLRHGKTIEMVTCPKQAVSRGQALDPARAAQSMLVVLDVSCGHALDPARAAHRVL